MTRAAAFLVGWALSIAVAVSARQDRPAFRAGVELIRLDVSVLDKDRHAVQNLAATDFTVLVDGLPRRVVAFKSVDVPPPLARVSAPWVREIAPDVVTNTHANGRVVVILIDDGSFYQVDPPMIGDSGTPVVDSRAIQKARASARAVVDELGPDDMAAVMFTENNRTAQNFTRDRRRLVAAIDNAALFPGPAQWDPRDPYQLQRGACGCGLCSIDTLAKIAETLRSLPEQRKIVVNISAGVPVFAHVSVPYTTFDDPYPAVVENCNARKKKAMEEAFRQAAMSNITIQSIDPKGLVVGFMGSGVAALENPSTLRVEFLRTIAESTGGRAVVNDNEMEQQVPGVLGESSSYYLLGVEPPATREDGRFHPIVVRVNQQGLDVRTRSGYYDPTQKDRKTVVAAGAPQNLDAAIGTLLPQTEVPLGVSVAPFATRDRKGAIAITLSITESTQASISGAARREQVEVIASAFEPTGGKGVGAQRQTVSLEWKPTNAADGQYEVLSRLPLPPGRYELRLGLKTGDAKTASVYTTVDVPNFANDDLSLSGLILTATPSPKFAPKNAFADLMSVVPTARRTFSNSDRVTAYLKVYQRRSGNAPAAVRTRITDTRNEIVAEELEVLEGAELGEIGADYQIDLPVQDLARGEYLLTIDVAISEKVLQRALRFRVR